MAALSQQFLLINRLVYLPAYFPNQAKKASASLCVQNANEEARRRIHKKASLRIATPPNFFTIVYHVTRTAELFNYKVSIRVCTI
jgi:hypothetical protein